MADVMVVNQPPRVLRKLGIAATRVRAGKPDLIHVAITGFGQTGLRADRTCYDLIAEGYSGVMDLTGETHRPAAESRHPGGRHAGRSGRRDGNHGSPARPHPHTGQGSSIDIALVDSMTRFLSCRIVPISARTSCRAGPGGRDSVIAIYQAFDTADHPMTLALGNDAIWSRFWAAVEHPAYAADPTMRTNADRVSARERIVATSSDCC